MQTFFFIGTYTPDSLNDARTDRTERVVGLIEDLNGHIVDIYGLLGGFDLVVIANLPGNTEAMKASIALSRETGIRFDTRPAVSVKKFDQLLSSSLQGEFPEFQFPDPTGRLPSDNELN